MSAIGDLVVNLVARTKQFVTPLTTSLGTLTQFAGGATTRLDEIADSSSRVQLTAGSASIALSGTALAASALGQSVPGISAAATAFGAVARAAGGTATASRSASTMLAGINRQASPLQQLSQIIGRVGAAATLVRVALMAVSFVMSRLGRDTSRIDTMARTLGRVALAALAARGAIFAASVAGRAFATVAYAPIRLAQSAWSGLTRVVQGASSALRSAASAGASALSSLSPASMGGGGFGGLAAGLGAAGLAGAIGMVAGSSVAMASSLETNSVAFGTLLGSAEAAQQHLTQLQQFAAKTPFEFPELVDASRRLMALGFDANQSIPILRIVGDAVGSLGLGSEGIDRVTLALGQMQSKGKVSAQEINQLAEAGIPAWKMIAEKIGVSIPEAMKMAENGAISSGTGINAVLEGMQSKFGGGMAKQASTLSGLWSTLKDSVGLVMTDIGQALIEGFDLKGAVSSVTGFVDTFRSDWMPSIRAAIRTVAEIWQGMIILLSEAWHGWLGESVGLLVDFVTNIDLYFGIAQENVGLWIANGITRFTTFFTNVIELAGWFAGNWRTILYDLANLYITVWGNVFANLRDLWTALLGYMNGEGFQFNATPLTQGFESALSEMPNLTQAAIAETTPELERLYNELGARQAAAAAKGIESTPTALAEEKFQALSEDNFAAADKQKKKKDGSSESKFAGALSRGSSDAVAAITKAQFGGGPTKKLEDLSKQQLAEQKKQSAALEALADGKGQPTEEVADFG